MSARKVIGWHGIRAGVQTREIVMTTSFQRAADAAGPSVTVGFLRKYGSKSENSEEWDIARRYPGVVCYRPLDNNPRKMGEGWFLDNGDPLTIDFNKDHAELLAAALMRVKRVRADVGDGEGWVELNIAEMNILAAASALGIPRSEIEAPS